MFLITIFGNFPALLFLSADICLANAKDTSPYAFAILGLLFEITDGTPLSESSRIDTFNGNEPKKFVSYFLLCESLLRNQKSPQRYHI